MFDCHKCLAISCGLGFRAERWSTGLAGRCVISHVKRTYVVQVKYTNRVDVPHGMVDVMCFDCVLCLIALTWRSGSASYPAFKWPAGGSAQEKRGKKVTFDQKEQALK